MKIKKYKFSHSVILICGLGVIAASFFLLAAAYRESEKSGKPFWIIKKIAASAPFSKVRTILNEAEKLGEPFGIAVRDDEIFFSDGETGRIWKITNYKDFTVVTDQLNTPSAIVFDKNGDLIVADSGTHTMMVEQAITAAPAVKKHVVAGQIHDGSDDVLTIRLEYPRLFVDHNGVDGPTLTSSYVLGTRFTVKIEAGDGQIKVYYNGSETPADTFPKSGSSNYFKAGAYTQSNCTREARCNTDNYGEVVIYRLEVTHR